MAVAISTLQKLFDLEFVAGGLDPLGEDDLGSSFSLSWSRDLL
jgi:hypothetical protein